LLGCIFSFLPFLKKKLLAGEDQLLFVFESCNMSVTPSSWFSMSPEILMEKKLQVDSGLFVALSAFDGHNLWGKLEDRHRVLFLEGFDAAEPGMLYPACRHHFSAVIFIISKNFTILYA
jgi:hypothetical protein